MIDANEFETWDTDDFRPDAAWYFLEGLKFLIAFASVGLIVLIGYMWIYGL